MKGGTDVEKTPDNIRLPEHITDILNVLNNAGYQAFAVGGCVRDMMLGTRPHDFDVTTSARPSQVMDVFRGSRLLETGLKHGTVTLLAQNAETASAEPVEITTFRSEQGYSDHRHPDKVLFTEDIKEDLARRDFTVNAMAADAAGRLYDPFGGRGDLEKQIIRCVGHPEDRFREDALRIMRALRFASRLGFDIEGKTFSAAEKNAGFLMEISPERVREELVGIVCGQTAGNVIQKGIEILRPILPELAACRGFDQKNCHHIYDVLEHTARAVDAAPPRRELRLAALFHDIGKPLCFTTDEEGTGHFYGHAAISEELTVRIMDRLRFDRKTAKKVRTLVKFHDAPIDLSERSIRRALNKFSPETFFDLIDLKRADNRAQAPCTACRQQTYDLLEAAARRMIEEDRCFSLRDLAVGGRDLIEEGMKQGPDMGEVLKYLLNLVIDGKAPNDRETLLAEAKKWQKGREH